MLCLSNGNADGLGKIREKELEKSAKFFNITKLETLNDELLPDGMKNDWNVD